MTEIKKTGPGKKETEDQIQDRIAAETEELVAKRTEELEKQTGKKITPFVFIDMDDNHKRVIGYLTEPDRLVKVRVMDKINRVGRYLASMELLESCLLKEASDKRIYTERPEYDIYYIGALKVADSLIVNAVNQFKKK